MRDESKHPEASFEANLDTQPDDQNSSQVFDDADRRGFLKCKAWAGTGLIWSFSGGVPVSRAFQDATLSGAAVEIHEGQSA
ncbi:hypothetical protein HNQ77_004475 [Silvibacterium bohemicum]|uniref:Uncharacterized protein n=1 Tax=Silvibacterium bohemicum TaxID=1577686 RepID=A0A841JYU0_9BACT|nr:hypothetical protein [Silvibacterium bohemicum]MBB6146496.1 hypothetical protein [Silvibacterium bohemicum]